MGYWWVEHVREGKGDGIQRKAGLSREGGGVAGCGHEALLPSRHMHRPLPQARGSVRGLLHAWLIAGILTRLHAPFRTETESVFQSLAQGLIHHTNFINICARANLIATNQPLSGSAQTSPDPRDWKASVPRMQASGGFGFESDSWTPKLVNY